MLIEEGDATTSRHYRGSIDRSQERQREIPIRWCGGAKYSFVPWDDHKGELRLSNFTVPKAIASQRLTSAQIVTASGMTPKVHYATGKFGCKGNTERIPQENFGTGATAKSLDIEDMSHSQLQLKACLEDINECNYEAAQAANVLPSLQLMMKQQPASLGVLQRFKTCALIGNSGHLLFKKYGQFIDQHEAVVRFNRLSTQGKYSPHVGSKTTLRVLNHQLSKDGCCKRQLHPDHNTSILLWHPGGKDEIIEQCWKNYPNQNTYALERQFSMGEAALMTAMRKDAMRFGISGFNKWRQLTSGAHGVLLMLRMCERVSLYGFTTFDSGRVARDQYTGRKGKNPDDEWWHDFEGESAAWRLLHASGRATVCSV